MLYNVYVNGFLLDCINTTKTADTIADQHLELASRIRFLKNLNPHLDIEVGRPKLCSSPTINDLYHYN